MKGPHGVGRFEIRSSNREGGRGGETLAVRSHDELDIMRFVQIWAGVSPSPPSEFNGYGCARRWLPLTVYSVPSAGGPSEEH